MPKTKIPLLEFLLSDQNGFQKTSNDSISTLKESDNCIANELGLFSTLKQIDEAYSGRTLELLVALAVAFEHEKRNKYLDLGDYIELINIVINPPTLIKDCKGCGGKMHKIHNSFLSFLWKHLKAESNALFPTFPELKDTKYVSEFWISRLEGYSFQDLRKESSSAKAESIKAKRSGNASSSAAYALASAEIENFVKVKLSYFETFLPALPKPEKKEEKPEVQDENFVKTMLMKHLDEGKSIKEISVLLKLSQRKLMAIKKEIEEQNK